MRLEYYSVRKQGGVRIRWSSTSPSLSQLWNPFCSDVGFITLCHHLLVYKPQERETVTYDVGYFIDSVIATVRNLPNSLTVNMGPITIESYASVASLIYNQSHLGFSLARGGVSF